jgi:Tfp pilus assembly protein PilX
MTRRMREERGSAMITALIATILMLGLGLALLAIVDTQADQSAQERTRDRGFNLAESVLTSEAFVLGRSWPATAPVAPAANPDCGADGAGFDDTIRQSTGTTAATVRLRNNLDASYTDAAYDGAKWQVNICDDVDSTTVWNDTLLTTKKTWDQNGNNKVWVRSQATVEGKTRAVAGLVEVRKTSAVDPKFGLVSGRLQEDLGSATSTITNAQVLGGLTNGLLNTNPPVAADLPTYPVPASGVTGLRCGLLDQAGEVRTCVAGALTALAAIPLIDTLVTGQRFQQYPSTSSSNASTIGQLRTQAKSAPGAYLPTAPGNSSVSAAPSCGITTPSDPDAVVFIEKVGDGDQYCVLDVSTSVRYKALVIGSGRVIIRGNGSITPYSTTTTNRFTGVIYALNLQTADQTLSTPSRPLVRIEKGARVRGAVHADGKNAQVGLIATDFDTAALVNTLLGCPSDCLLADALNGLFGTLGVSGTVDALINGQCLLSALGICTLFLPPLAGGATAVLSGITAQLADYGSAIRSDVDVIKALQVYGASGVVSGTFRDLQAR